MEGGDEVSEAVSEPTKTEGSKPEMEGGDDAAKAKVKEEKAAEKE
jgi:hypothetical protein